MTEPDIARRFTVSFTDGRAPCVSRSTLALHPKLRGDQLFHTWSPGKLQPTFAVLTVDSDLEIEKRTAALLEVDPLEEFGGRYCRRQMEAETFVDILCLRDRGPFSRAVSCAWCSRCVGVSAFRLQTIGDSLTWPDSIANANRNTITYLHAPAYCCRL